MKNKEREEELTMCLACLGSAELYDAEGDEGVPCKYCEATGTATDAENEIYLSIEVNKD